jgi:hypothetical protein
MNVFYTRETLPKSRLFVAYRLETWHTKLSQKSMLHRFTDFAVNALMELLCEHVKGRVCNIDH